MKNNSIKYSSIVKALCFALSVVMFALFVSNSTYALMPLNCLTPEEAFSDNRPEFSKSDYAERIFNRELCYLNLICDKTVEEYEKEIKSEKKEQTEAALKSFVDYKTEIIRGELAYVAENNEDYNSDYADGLTESYVDSIPDTPEKERKYVIDPYLPAGVRVARKVLNYAQGDEFLKYENLIRQEAFDQSFTYPLRCGSFASDTVSISFQSSAEEAKKIIGREYDSIAERAIQAYSAEYKTAVSETSELINIKYYIKSGDKILTNMKEAKSERAVASEYSLYCAKSGKKDLQYRGQSHDAFYQNSVNDYFKNCSEVTVYMLNETDFTGNDYVVSQCRVYNRLNYSVKPNITKAIVFFIISVSALIIMLNLSGHKRGYDGITLSFIDKVPGDIHFAVSAAFSVGCIFLFAELADELLYFDNCSEIGSMIQPLMLFGCVLWMVFIEWLASVVRTVKSERKYFGNFIIVRVIIYILRLIKKLVLSIRNSALRYKPKYFNKKIIAVASCFAVLSPFAVVFAMAVTTNEYDNAVLVAFIMALVGVIAVMYYRKNIKNLDRIIEASQKRESVDFGNEKLPQALEILNESLKISNEEMRRAVDKAVRNERTKAELITNVSHDLKTPLTSVISYVDLLKGCDIESEDARNYIKIIDEKSNNLKTLIENLIEASKVSAGNVKLNKTKINLKELVIQSVVEYSAEFESRNIDLRFNDNCESVTAFADGQHTYRIIDNLLSNAKKYSAPNTRVYASLRQENGFGIFEIKNTSKAPLDISPEELTERFVRGDASRGEEEGNGLGLSIAKELCVLQGGKLEISIDGDLFKATVYLPE